MPRIITVKVAVPDYEAAASAVYDLTDSMGTIYRQEDVVFAVDGCGQLKLSSIDGSPAGDLVYHSNLGTKQPAESEYHVTHILDRESFKKVMAAAVGIKGIVKRQRRLYEYGTAVKIWLDDVLDLGHFLMIEYDLPPQDEDYSQGVKFVLDLAEKLGLNEADFLSDTYVDMFVMAASRKSDEPSAEITGSLTPNSVALNSSSASS